MVLVATYIAAALLVAPSIFVAAEWVGHDHSPRPPHRLAYCVLAAVLWPLLVVGLAQFAVIAAVRHMSRSSGPTSPMFEPSGDDADTAKLPVLAVPWAQMGTSAT
jgi:hypothetical protein